MILTHWPAHMTGMSSAKHSPEQACVPETEPLHWSTLLLGRFCPVMPGQELFGSGSVLVLSNLKGITTDLPSGERCCILLRTDAPSFPFRPSLAPEQGVSVRLRWAANHASAKLRLSFTDGDFWIRLSALRRFKATFQQHPGVKRVLRESSTPPCRFLLCCTNWNGSGQPQYSHRRLHGRLGHNDREHEGQWCREPGRRVGGHKHVPASAWIPCNKAPYDVVQRYRGVKT